MIFLLYRHFSSGIFTRRVVVGYARRNFFTNKNLVTMYYYKRTEFSPHCLYTVGHDENGKWIPESDHEDIHSASRRVNFLNGGVEETIESDELATLRAENAQLREALEGILRVVNVRIDDPRVAQFDTARAALNSGIIFSPNP